MIAKPVKTMPPSPRGGALDALRLLAAVFVLIFHFGDEAPVALERLHGFFARGYLATDFFLLLSGFVLARAYGGAVLSGQVGHGEFLARRVARIYPAHLITLSCLVMAVLAAELSGHRLHHHERFVWQAVPENLLLIHAWGLGGGSWNVPSWTLSALLACYAAFPWLWRATSRIGQPGVCLAVALGVVLGGDLIAHGLAGQEQFDLPFRWGVLRAAPLFLAGLVLARLVETARLGATAARSIALGGCAVFLADAIAPGPDFLAVLATGAVIVGCGALPVGRGWPGAAQGAKLSFALFITHTLSAVAFFDLVRPVLLREASGAAWQWGVWFAGLGFALAAAAGFHYLVDAPLQKRLAGALFRPRPAPGPALAPSV